MKRRRLGEGPLKVGNEKEADPREKEVIGRVPGTGPEKRRCESSTSYLKEEI